MLKHSNYKLTKGQQKEIKELTKKSEDKIDFDTFKETMLKVKEVLSVPGFDLKHIKEVIEERELKTLKKFVPKVEAGNVQIDMHINIGKALARTGMKQELNPAIEAEHALVRSLQEERIRIEE